MSSDKYQWKWRFHDWKFYAFHFSVCLFYCYCYHTLFFLLVRSLVGVRSVSYLMPEVLLAENLYFVFKFSDFAHAMSHRGFAPVQHSASMMNLWLELNCSVKLTRWDCQQNKLFLYRKRQYQHLLRAEVQERESERERQREQMRQLLLVLLMDNVLYRERASPTEFIAKLWREWKESAIWTIFETKLITVLWNEARL